MNDNILGSADEIAAIKAAFQDSLKSAFQELFKSVIDARGGGNGIDQAQRRFGVAISAARIARDRAAAVVAMVPAQPIKLLSECGSANIES